MSRIPRNVLRMRRADFDALTDEQVERVRQKAGLEADWGATSWRRSDGWRVLELAESVQRRRRHEPAEKGDVRYDIGERDEEGYRNVLVIDDHSRVVDAHYLRYDEVGAFVASEREAQHRRAEADRLGVHPLELEFAPFGPAWQREQEER